jgi:5-methylcytosine-specific restriction protein B
MNTADKSVEALDSALRRRFTFIETPPEPEKLQDIGVKSIVYLFEKFKHVDWYDEPWVTHEKDLLNLIINRESFETLGKAYDKVNPGIGKIPKNWGVDAARDLVLKSGTEFIDFEKMLKVMNNRVEKLLDKDHRIGHAYFINLHQCDFPFAELKKIFSNKILPLLQEYFFGDYGKIGLVLGDSFVVKHSENNTDYGFAKFKGYSEESVSDLKERTIFKFTDSKTWTTETFTSIYL